MDEDRFIRMCPCCAVCGDPITDDVVRVIGNECYHDDCIERVSLDTWLDNYEDVSPTGERYRG